MNGTSSRPTRPLPSRNGWIVSNCTCASAALMTAGVESGSSCKNRRAPPCNLARDPRVVERRSHRLVSPHPPSSGSCGIRLAASPSPTASHQDLVHPRIRRFESGYPSLMRAPARAPRRSSTPRRHHRTALPGGGDLKQQQVRERRLRPSICDDTTASFRT